MKKILLCAFFAALTAVLSQIIIPIGPVPINLALISVFTAGGVLGWKGGGVSQAIFVLLGIVGLPVFAGLHGGIGALVGPTGGFIMGYIPCAMLSGFVRRKWMGMLFGLAVLYIMGSFWYVYVTKAHILAAVMACIIPFIIGDSLKILLSNVLVKRIRRNYSGN